MHTGPSEEIMKLAARCFRADIAAVMAYGVLEDGQDVGPWSVSRTTDISPLANRWSHTHLYAYPISIGVSGIGLLFSSAFSAEQANRLFETAENLRCEGDPILLGFEVLQ